MMRLPKPYRPGVKAAEAAGWTLDTTRNSHWRLKPPKPVTWPGGQMVTQIIFSGSTSDRRSIRNFEADLRRSGIVW